MESKDIAYITQLVIAALNEAQSADSHSDRIPVGVSARHIHLTQQHVDILFGAGYQLTKKKDLMGGQYACNETVGIVSQKMKMIEKVRVLGPLRNASQLELSATDALKLGMKVPLRDSGDTVGSAPITIIGPVGAVSLTEGCIIAARHIHMTPEEAERFGVIDGQMASVRFEGERTTVYEAVRIRVSPSFTLEMHIDTDEASAACIKTGDFVKLVK